MPRAGHVGLTNRACEKWDDKNNCIEYVIVDYNLSKKELRETLIKLDFICNVGGKRFRIDRNRPGLIRNQYKKELFGKYKLIKSDYIDQSNQEFLTASKTRCFKDGKYPFD